MPIHINMYEKDVVAKLLVPNTNVKERLRVAVKSMDEINSVIDFFNNNPKLRNYTKLNYCSTDSTFTNYGHSAISDLSDYNYIYWSDIVFKPKLNFKL